MQFHFIINPAAGKKDYTDFLKKDIKAAAKTSKIDMINCKIHISKYPKHTCKIAEQIAKTGEECVIFSVGGDGTFSEIMSSVYTYSNVSVGCLPCGSGNDFVRNFGGKENFLDLKKQFEGKAHLIDLIKTNTGISSCICSAGLDADIAYAMPKFKKIPFCGGSMAYNLAILQCLTRKLGKSYTIKIDDEILNGDYLFAAFCNGKAYGGGFLAAPEARLADGLLDVVLVRKVSLTLIAKIIGKYKKGEHIKNGEIVPELRDIFTFKRAKKITLEPMNKNEVLLLNIDGEIAKAKQFSAEVLSLKGQIFLPKNML